MARSSSRREPREVHISRVYRWLVEEVGGEVLASMMQVDDATILKWMKEPPQDEVTLNRLGVIFRHLRWLKESDVSLLSWIEVHGQLFKLTEPVLLDRALKRASDRTFDRRHGPRPPAVHRLRRAG